VRTKRRPHRNLPAKESAEGPTRTRECRSHSLHRRTRRRPRASRMGSPSSGGARRSTQGSRHPRGVRARSRAEVRRPRRDAGLAGETSRSTAVAASSPAGRRHRDRNSVPDLPRQCSPRSDSRGQDRGDLAGPGRRLASRRDGHEDPPLRLSGEPITVVRTSSTRSSPSRATFRSLCTSSRHRSRP